MADIGTLLFVDILRMADYPGYPFTGNIFQDLVIFFFVPTVFLILVVYMAVGRLLHPEHGKLRLLVAVAAYAFIIAGGYFSFFARLAGPYFIFLIFIMGVLYFFFEHFRRGGRGGIHLAPAPGGQGYAAQRPNFADMNWFDLIREKKRLEALIRDTDKEIHDAKGERVEMLRQDIVRYRDELRSVEHQLKFVWH